MERTTKWSSDLLSLSPHHPLTLWPPYFLLCLSFSPSSLALSTFISETFDTGMTPLPLALLKVKFNPSSQTRHHPVFLSVVAQRLQSTVYRKKQRENTDWRFDVMLPAVCRWYEVKVANQNQDQWLVSLTREITLYQYVFPHGVSSTCPENEHIK